MHYNVLSLWLSWNSEIMSILKVKGNIFFSSKDTFINPSEFSSLDTVIVSISHHILKITRESISEQNIQQIINHIVVVLSRLTVNSRKKSVNQSSHLAWECLLCGEYPQGVLRVKVVLLILPCLPKISYPVPFCSIFWI